MTFTEAEYDKWIDKALSISSYRITIAEIRKQAKEKEAGDKKKKQEPYYLTYPWKKKEDWEEWIKAVKNDVKRWRPNLSAGMVEREVNMIDMLIGLGEGAFLTADKALQPGEQISFM